MSDLSERSDMALRWQLGILTATGGAMRLALVLVATPGHDESYTHVNFVVPSWWTALSDYSLPNNHVLHTLAARVAHVLTNGGLTATRLPALIAGVAVIPLTGVLTYRLTRSRSSSLVAAAIVTVWPQMIWYSADARGYTMVAMFAVTLALISHRLMQGDRRPHHWLAWSAVVAAGAFTVPIFLYPAVAIGLWLVVGAKREDQLDRRFLLEATAAGAVAGILTAVAYWPVLTVNGLDALTGNRFVEPATWSDWAHGIGAYLGDVASWALREIPDLIAVVLIGALLVGLIRRDRSSEPHVLLAFLVLASITTMAVQRVQPFPRIWLFVIPFFVAASAEAVSLPRGNVGIGLGIAFLVLTISLFSVQLIDPDSRLRRVETTPDIAEVVRIVGEKYPDGTQLIVGPADIPQYGYAALRHPSVSVQDGSQSVLVANHRFGYELDQLLSDTGLSLQGVEVLARLPHTTLYSVLQE